MCRFSGSGSGRARNTCFEDGRSDIEFGTRRRIYAVTEREVTQSGLTSLAWGTLDDVNAGEGERGDDWEGEENSPLC